MKLAPGRKCKASTPVAARQSHVAHARGSTASRNSSRERNSSKSGGSKNKGIELPPNARKIFEDLSNEDSRVLDLDNIVDGFYIAPKFLDKLAVHCAKNYMHKALTKIRVPLILGVWGGKGQGKTFQVTLALKAMNVESVIMSAGELEAGQAGEPAKLLRQRYREAGELINKNKMSALFINDLDAGAGRMGESTQYTVNNQMVNATLMNIADNPTNVQLSGSYKTAEVPRVPVIVTGNDFSTLYAPLIRDGRMEKYYWNPTRADRIGVCRGIFKEDNLTEDEVIELVDEFPGQSIDFFGALRSRIYDDAVRSYSNEIGYESLHKTLVKKGGKDPVSLPLPNMTHDLLLEYGHDLVEEQDNVKRVQLSEEYIQGASLAGESGTSNPEEARED